MFVCLFFEGREGCCHQMKVMILEHHQQGVFLQHVLELVLRQILIYFFYQSRSHTCPSRTRNRLGMPLPEKCRSHLKVLQTDDWYCRNDILQYRVGCCMAGLNWAVDICLCSNMHYAQFKRTVHMFKKPSTYEMLFPLALPAPSLLWVYFACKFQPC